MKHWSEFVPKRTQTTKRLAKISNSLTFDIQQLEIDLKAKKESHQENESLIIEKLSKQYESQYQTKRAIETALQTADKWNNSPVLEQENPNKKKTL